MAGRLDGSAIKALFPPSKGDPPTTTKKKNKSPSSKNDPPPDQSIILPSPFKNTPLPEQSRKSPSPHKNAPPPDQNENSPSSDKMKSRPPPQLMTTNKRIWKHLESPTENSGRRRGLTPAGKGHIQPSAGAWSYIQFRGVRQDQKKRTVSEDC